MAKFTHCKNEQRVRQTRLVSNDGRFDFQYLMVLERCKICGQRVMRWKGMFPNGMFSIEFDIPVQKHSAWLKREETDVAKPEIELIGEYTQLATRDPASGKFLRRYLGRVASFL